MHPLFLWLDFMHLRFNCTADGRRTWQSSAIKAKVQETNMAINTKIQAQKSADTSRISTFYIIYRLNYSIILSTTPAPTVLPPSRIANFIPCSIATGLINSTSITTLSPGITISPSNLIEPVTSVVLM